MDRQGDRCAAAAHQRIVHGKRGISADTALRLSRALGLSDMFFINMQAHYYAEIAREQLATELATIQRIA